MVERATKFLTAIEILEDLDPAGGGWDAATPGAVYAELARRGWSYMPALRDWAPVPVPQPPSGARRG